MCWMLVKHTFNLMKVEILAKFECNITLVTLLIIFNPAYFTNYLAC